MSHSEYLRRVEGGGLSYWCPGCKEMHSISVGEGPGPRWGWNGDMDNPTFTPSVLVRSGHHSSYFKPGDRCWCVHAAENPDEEPVFKCVVCHTFITDGMVQFLDDCTHELAGKTVPLPPWSDRGY